jgi:hypothetical protein
MRNQKSLIEGENAKVKRSNSNLQLGTAYHSSAPEFTPGFLWYGTEEDEKQSKDTTQ